MKKVTPEQFEREVMKDLNALKKGVADKYQRRVIDKMPVLTGQMVGNTNAAIGYINKLFVKGMTDPNRNDRKNFNTEVINKSGLRDFITITSTVPYSQRIEFEGWSKKAPNGMFRISALEFSVMVQELKNGDIRQYRT